jgi:hypothetical protein
VQELRPRAVRVLAWLLALTAAATVVVELLIWWYAGGGDFGLFVRTGWALLRSLAFLLLIRHVLIGRASARPFGLILAVTTLFAVARLVVPKEGLPAAPGILGFTVLCGLCLADIVLLYRSAAVGAYLKRHAKRVVIDRTGIRVKAAPSKRPPVPGWWLTARVAALAYTPLMMVPAIVSIGLIFDGEPAALSVVAAWILAALAIGYAVAVTMLFVLRGHRWARYALVLLTVIALGVDLPLCWLLLDVDGLVRDGGPLVATAGLALYGLWRGGIPSARPHVHAPNVIAADYRGEASR